MVDTTRWLIFYAVLVFILTTKTFFLLLSMNSIVIPFIDISVPINTLLGLALFLLIFFTFFSVSFKLNVGEGDDTNLACNRRRPEETDGEGANKSSWYSGAYSDAKGWLSDTKSKLSEYDFGVSSDDNDENSENTSSWFS